MTFITEYRELAVSAWGFLVLMNFLEALLQAFYEKNNEY